MNKDEIIEEMAKIANFSAFDFTQGTIQSKTIYTAMAEALYNANCRIIADDEMVIKKSEHKALLLEQKRLKEMVDRIPCGYVKIAEDEIVVKKREYEQLKKHNRDRKRLRLRWQQAKQETAREILQRFYNRAKSNKNDFADVNSYEIELMAEEFGIELE